MDRKALKAAGKAAFLNNYWPSVLAGLCWSIAGGAGVGGISLRFRTTQTLDASDPRVAEFFVRLMPVFFVAGISSLAISIFVLNPLLVGACGFFKHNHLEQAAPGELGSGFEGNYLHNVATLLLESVFVFLWALLLVIPGIIKALSYAMTPFLLKDHPELSARETLALSQQMMSGHKWEYFVLGLSFIGWQLLSALTLGLLGVFYVNPYQCSAFAAFYLRLCEEAGLALPEGV